MKIILTLLFMLSVSLRGELLTDSKSTEKYIFDLRKKIESKDQNFAEYSKLHTSHRKSQLPTKQKSRYEELTLERVSTHKMVIKLREHLQRGRSVFDYPGLLALGKINHNGTIYRLTISAGVKYGRPASIFVRFDNSGKILGIYTAIVTK